MTLPIVVEQRRQPKGRFQRTINDLPGEALGRRNRSTVKRVLDGNDNASENKHTLPPSRALYQQLQDVRLRRAKTTDRESVLLTVVVGVLGPLSASSQTEGDIHHGEKGQEGEKDKVA